LQRFDELGFKTDIGGYLLKFGGKVGGVVHRVSLWG
jgi:hypothetical protein